MFPQDVAGQSYCTGRRLIGWSDPNIPGEYLEKAKQAQVLVASRARYTGYEENPICSMPVGFNQSDYTQYISILKQRNIVPQFSDGWQIQIVDLSKVRATQKYIFDDGVNEVTREADANNIVSLMKIAFPLQAPPPDISYNYDVDKKTHTFISPNPNLSVLSVIPMPDAPEGTEYAAVIGIKPSYLTIANIEGHYLILDGSHRAYSLLRKGINQVPAFVVELSTLNMTLDHRYFSPEVIFSDRPPLMADFLDDRLCMETRFSVKEKRRVVLSVS